MQTMPGWSWGLTRAFSSEPGSPPTSLVAAFSFSIKYQFPDIVIWTKGHQGQVTIRSPSWHSVQC